MKGILLAGGSGSRLYPLTAVTSKQLLPVYDKPTIYYPLSILMLAGIREIAIISTPRDTPILKSLFQDGSQLGLDIKYIIQNKPNGIAEAFLLAENFIAGDCSCLILGDNIFYGHGLTQILNKSCQLTQGAIVSAYRVQNPKDFGVVSFDSKGNATNIVEKPIKPDSDWALTGLYFYDQHVTDYAKQLTPSSRGELEITDLNKAYLQSGKLKVQLMGRGIAWLDTGTHEGLLESSQFVQTIEKRQGLKIACLEEIALKKGFISLAQFQEIAEKYPHNNYGSYLRNISKTLK